MTSFSNDLINHAVTQCSHYKTGKHFRNEKITNKEVLYDLMQSKTGNIGCLLGSNQGFCHC